MLCSVVILLKHRQVLSLYFYHKAFGLLGKLLLLGGRLILP